MKTLWNIIGYALQTKRTNKDRMTKEEAEARGIFHKWSVFSCQSCSKYKKIADISEYYGLLVCLNCLRDLQRKEAEMGKLPSLFDEKPL